MKRQMEKKEELQTDIENKDLSLSKENKQESKKEKDS